MHITHRFIPTFVSLAFASALCSVSVFAQTDEDTTMESMVVTGTLSGFGATKSDVPIVETARSISIETSDQFIDKGALNLSQTASYSAGVTAETFGFSTRGDWIHSRGLDVPRYRDSIQELFGSYNTTRADIYTIEQVELLKGPASVLYGQGSPGGIVNYVSKTPNGETGGELVVNYGSYNRRELALDYTGSLSPASDTWQYRMVAKLRDSDTQVDEVTDDALVLMPSIAYAPSEDTRFTLIGLYQKNEGDVGAQFIPIEGTLEPLANGGYIDQDVYAGEPDFNFYNTESSQVTLLGEHQFGANTRLDFTALWRDGEADYQQAWPTFTGAGASRYLNQIFGVTIATDTTVPRSFYQADNTSEQYAADIRVSHFFTTSEFEHELLLGAQYQDVETDNNTAYYYGGGALSGDLSYVLDLADPQYTGAPDQSVFDAIYTDNPIQTVADSGIYLSDQIVYSNWHITLGLRYDEVKNDTGTVTQTDSAVSTSAGVLYRFENGISPYLSFAESFETVIGTNLAGDAFEPEEGRQYEAGIKYEPSSFNGLFTLAYFDIEISNLDNPDSLPADAAQQQGISTLKGLEFEGKATLGEFYLQMALSTLDAQDPNGYELAGEPEGSASFWTTWRPEGELQGFKLGGGVRHVGESVAENATLRYETPSYTLGDLLVGYEFSNGLDLALNVRNITDEEYLTSCLTRGDCFPGVRRSVTASIRYEL